MERERVTDGTKLENHDHVDKCSNFSFISIHRHRKTVWNYRNSKMYPGDRRKNSISSGAWGEEKIMTSPWYQDHQHVYMERKEVAWALFGKITKHLEEKHVGEMRKLLGEGRKSEWPRNLEHG